MYLRQITLQNYRNYKKANFTFDSRLTVIVGPNASGKSNLVEAIRYLSTGKSFRTSKEKQVIGFGELLARINGKVFHDASYQQNAKSKATESEDTTIEVILSELAESIFRKKYLINGVSKKRTSFSGLLPTVLFTPLDLAIVSGQPGDKRRYLDEILEQTDSQYAASLVTYTKALRQRNALLEFVQKNGRRDEERFSYWDNLLITNGTLLTQKREACISYLNGQEKKVFPFVMTYDKSLMSHERLLQYKDAEVGAGMTLVGPQRDDVLIQSMHPVSKEFEDVRYFCSRGQQRLVTLELKKLQIKYLMEHTTEQPLLILDDIFSELDSEHIRLVIDMTNNFQTVITTTHKEFINSSLENAAVIELGKQ